MQKLWTTPVRVHIAIATEVIQLPCSGQQACFIIEVRLVTLTDGSALASKRKRIFVLCCGEGIALHSVALEVYHDWSGKAAATTCELYAKIIAESELLQPALNEIHKFCFQHWSRGRGTCGTGSGAPALLHYALLYVGTGIGMAGQTIAKLFS